jgi:hypothetical protein
VSSTIVSVSLPTFLCLRPSSLFRRQHFYGIDHALCFSANFVVSSTIGKAFPTIGKIDCRRIVLLFNKIAIVFNHGRQGFADWFCLSANSFVSPPMFLALRLTAGRLRECFWRFPQRYCAFADVFGSPPMVSCLRRLSLPLRQCFCVFDHYLCFFANGREAPAIVFVSSPMVVIPASLVFASAIARFSIP